MEAESALWIGLVLDAVLIKILHLRQMSPILSSTKAHLFNLHLEIGLSKYHFVSHKTHALHEHGILKEQFLAPITLYSGRTRLYLECHSSHACESQLWDTDLGTNMIFHGLAVSRRSSFILSWSEVSASTRGLH